jgi:diadenosine tetraphosphate (Ap4A) HIT family hydrolase
MIGAATIWRLKNLVASALRVRIAPLSSIGVATTIDMSNSSSDWATAMAKFSLHERLRADTIELTRWALSIVLLMNVRHWPWLVLVPRRPAIREIHELQETDQRALTAEIVRASRTLTSLVQPHKINIAALGNVVPQLHVHVIARFTDDPAWPKAVWGSLPPEPYPPVELQQRVKSFQKALADS